MRKLLFVILLIFVLVCSVSWAKEEDKPRTGGPFEVKLKKPVSKYWMYVPEEYTPRRSWPLMVVLHGAGGSAGNFIRAFVSEARNNKYIIVAVKSPGHMWGGGDDKLILKVMKDVRGQYSVDAERIFLTGFSAGSYMACLVGFKNHFLFRGLGSVAGAQVVGNIKAAKRMTVLIVCGDQDLAYRACQKVYEMLKKQRFDTELCSLPGVGHVFDSRAVPWLFNQFQERLNRGKELIKRGKKASVAKRYLDAIDCFRQVIKEQKGEKFEKIARRELEKIDQKADKKFKQVLIKLKSDKKDAAIKLLEEIILRFEGVSTWKKAKEKLGSIEKEKTD